MSEQEEWRPDFGNAAGYHLNGMVRCAHPMDQRLTSPHRRMYCGACDCSFKLWRVAAPTSPAPSLKRAQDWAAAIAGRYLYHSPDCKLPQEIGPCAPGCVVEWTTDNIMRLVHSLAPPQAEAEDEPDFIGVPSPAPVPVMETLAALVSHGPTRTGCTCPGCKETVPACWASDMCRACCNEDCEHDEPAEPQVPAKGEAGGMSAEYIWHHADDMTEPTSYVVRRGDREDMSLDRGRVLARCGTVEDAAACAEALRALHSALPANTRPEGERDDPGVLQDDLTEIMRALGISVHARPVSPHRVMVDEVIPSVRAVGAALRLNLPVIRMYGSLRGLAAAETALPPTPPLPAGEEKPRPVGLCGVPVSCFGICGEFLPCSRHREAARG